MIGYENLYMISNFGNIISLNKNIIMKQKYDKDGYLSIILRKDGKNYYHRVSRLVGFNFINNPNNYPIINHLDGKRDNNHESNLEWCNNSMNQKHRFEVNMNGYVHSKYQHNFKKIKATNINSGEFTIFISANECARFFNLSDSAIWNRLKGRVNNPSITVTNSLFNIFLEEL